MTPLRQKMIQEMKMRNFSDHTQHSYLAAIRRFAQHYNHSPENISIEQAQQYILYLQQEKKLSWSTCNLTVSSLRFLNTAVLKKEHCNLYLPFGKKEKRLPDVFTKDEIKQFLNSIDNPKYKALFTTIYSTGLRIGEALNLTINDIDSKANVICVRQGKRRKDRYAPLPQVLLTELRNYWKLCKTKHWLFTGHQSNKLCQRTANKAFTAIKKKVGCTKDVTVHGLRHSFATHLLEDNVDIFTIKQLLGHSSINSTLRYVHISRELVSRLPSPLESL